jgi:hypothetical protein
MSPVAAELASADRAPGPVAGLAVEVVVGVAGVEAVGVEVAEPGVAVAEGVFGVLDEPQAEAASSAATIPRPAAAVVRDVMPKHDARKI